MIADFYAKLLKGLLFIKIRNFVVGLDDEFYKDYIENSEYSDETQSS